MAVHSLETDKDCRPNLFETKGQCLEARVELRMMIVELSLLTCAIKLEVAPLKPLVNDLKAPIFARGMGRCRVYIH